MGDWGDMLADLTEMPKQRMRIIGTWLVEEVDECTGGACGLGYGHEPGCGQEPIVDLSTLPGWEDWR